MWSVVFTSGQNGWSRFSKVGFWFGWSGMGRCFEVWEESENICGWVDGCDVVCGVTFVQFWIKCV